VELNNKKSKEMSLILEKAEEEREILKEFEQGKKIIREKTEEERNRLIEEQIKIRNNEVKKPVRKYLMTTVMPMLTKGY
jgi:hypothetical protein